MMQSSFVLFAFKLFCDFVKIWIALSLLAPSETAYVIVMFFYFNVSLKDKLVIELNSLANVDCLRSRKFVCSLKVFVVLEFFVLCTTGGVLLVLMIRVSDRIVDVPCESNSLRWDRVCLVRETVMPYLAILCLMIRASRRLSCGFWLMDS